MAILLSTIITASIFAWIFFYLSSATKQALSELRGRFDYAQNELNNLRNQKDRTEEKYLEKIDILQDRLMEFEKDNSVLDLEKRQLEQEKKEWHKNKEALLFQLSEELIRKNNEQQQKISTFQQENIKKITENLFKNFENITNKVSSLNDDVKKSSDEINLTKQALLNPGASGRTAEITLENILKNSGLKEKQDLQEIGDYVLQSHFSGVVTNLDQESKRPDAILFLPNNQIVIIDSKTSSHFLELELARQNHDFEQEKILLGKIKEAFKRHLESLRRKDYSKFLLEELHQKNISDYKIFIIMFLQTERMLEIVRETDAEFEQKAFESGVMLSSPIGLINLLSQARLVIDRSKQEKNVELLKMEIRKLLDNLSMVFKESKELGRYINKAATSHNKIAKNLNRQIYNSIKNVTDLGVESKKSGDIKLLEEYDEEERFEDEDNH
jgi:DNA recombination protein RmuC